MCVSAVMAEGSVDRVISRHFYIPCPFPCDDVLHNVHVSTDLPQTSCISTPLPLPMWCHSSSQRGSNHHHRHHTLDGIIQLLSQTARAARPPHPPTHFSGNVSPYTPALIGSSTVNLPWQHLLLSSCTAAIIIDLSLPKPTQQQSLSASALSTRVLKRHRRKILMLNGGWWLVVPSWARIPPFD